MKTKTVPHPIPYQGSKRNLAAEILRYFPPKFATLYEPFAGSAAITVTAAVNELGDHYHINDLNKPLMDLWRAIIETPQEIASQYENLWHKQLQNPRSFYDTVRDDFNRRKQYSVMVSMSQRATSLTFLYPPMSQTGQWSIG